MKLAGFTVTENISCVGRIAYARATCQKGEPAMLKYYDAARPDEKINAHWRYEHSLLQSIDSEYIIKIKAIKEDLGRVVLAMEDFAAVPLRLLIEHHHLSFSKRLELACQLVSAITELHQQSLLHRNLNPDNIFVNPDTLQLKIADLAKATRYKWQRARVDLDCLWGSAAYMSPELLGTGRIPVDHRSDFYTLGVLLYQLFGGNKPFVSDDFASLVQAQTIREAESLDVLDNKIPLEISAIVQKLLAKSVDERYHSHQSLYADLKDCQKQWQTKGQIDHFPIAQVDIPDSFCLTRKIYGRDIELTGIMAAFERASLSQTELVLLSGEAGIGKSTLVYQLYDAIVGKRGFFISGRFDKDNRNQPYRALVSAFSGLMRHLSFETEERLKYWRGKLKNALGINAAVITQIIPDVALLCDDIPELPRLPAAETEKRLHITFGHFVRALSSSGHPLVIFLDDLQWADDATLRLLTHLTIADRKNAVLLIGAYRDEDTTRQSALERTVQKIELSQGRVNRIHLQPLARHHIQQLIGDSFGSPLNEAALLCNEIFERGGGNPLFVKQYLKALYEQKMLYFDRRQNQWIWCLVEIPDTLDFTDTVALLTARLHRLEWDCQHLLSLAAHLGNRFSLEKLTMVSEQPLKKVARSLIGALKAEFIVPLDENYNFFTHPQLLASAQFRFKHDQHRQAAQALVNDKERAALLLNIGRLLLKNTPQHRVTTELYQLLGPFNSGREHIVDAAEKSRLLTFNIRAGVMAKDASAFEVAVNLLRIAKSMQVADSWALFPNQTITLYKELAEAEFLAGNFEQTRALVEEGLNQATDTQAKITLLLVQSEQCQQQGGYEQSATLLNQGLSLLGRAVPLDERLSAERLPELIAEVESKLQNLETSNILALPEMTQQTQLLATELYFNLLVNLFKSGRMSSYGECACRMLLLSLEHGQSDFTASAICAYLSIFVKIGHDHQRAYRLGKLAIDLSDHRGNKYHRSYVYQMFSGRYQHWREPLQNAFAFLQQVIGWGHEGISLSDACEAVLQLNILKTIKGTHLPTLTQSIRQGLEFVHLVNNKSAERHLLLGALQPALALQGETVDPWSFDDDSVSLDKWLDNRQGGGLELALYSYAMLRHAYLMDNRRLLPTLIDNIPTIETYFPDSPLLTECYFYGALSLLGFASPGESRFVEYLSQARFYVDKLKTWSEQCPQNYEHKYLIVAAEMARIGGDIQSAASLFDNAIEASEKAGYIQCEALANERFADFWLNENQSRVAKSFIKEAHYLYLRWGAQAKCDQLQEQWPHVNFKYSEGVTGHFDDSRPAMDEDDNSRHSTLPDIHALFKANQMLAQELQKAPLLKVMMSVMLEQTRAQYGAIIFDVDSQLIVEMTGRMNALDGTVQCLQTNTTLAEICAETPPKLPGALIRYVQQTQEPLLLKIPAEDVRFSHNEYLQQFQPISTLLLPIIHQNRFLAVVYLENNLPQLDFGSGHLEGLQMLASQAAVSLTNAAAFKILEQKNAKRKAQLSKEREKSDRASQTKSLFLANMSHEIRTPLTTVIGFAEGILFGDIEPQNHHQAIQTIANSGKHLLLLINDILDFSKIEAGQLQVEKIDVNLIELLANLESVTRVMVKSKPIDFNIDLQLPLPDIISTDPTRLNQILLNLMSNAVKFTESGSVTLKVYPQFDQLVMSVIDTGVGIKPEKISSLFYAFEQADKTVQRKYGGTGLGLTISKSLAQMLGGDILCTSEPDIGSTFTLTIELVTTGQTRLIDSPDILAQTRQALDVAKSHSTSTLDGNILVAEDQPENLQLITTMLKKMGLSVTGVANGQEAIEAYLVDDFDLILLDIQMPIMDGLETLDMLNSINNDTPVIALTANAMKHEVEEYFRKGFDEHLSKPIERKPFVEKISRFLGQDGDNIDASLSEEELHLLKKQFSDNLPAYLERIDKHFSEHDDTALQHEAHALKGAAGTLGFEHLSRLAADLEQALKDGHNVALGDKVEALLDFARAQLEALA